MLVHKIIKIFVFEKPGIEFILIVSVNFDAYGSNSLIGRKIDAYESAMPAADGLFE